MSRRIQDIIKKPAALTIVIVVVCCVNGVCAGQSNAPPQQDWTEAPLTKIYGEWKHVSPSSAVIYWQTDGAARSWVEYGKTTEYGLRTKATEKSRFAHLHRLKKLESGVAYHYRLVSEGINGEKVLSNDMTLTPMPIKGAIRIPDDIEGKPEEVTEKKMELPKLSMRVGGATDDSDDESVSELIPKKKTAQKLVKKPPFVLDKPDTTYILTQDIKADWIAIHIKAKNVTLDLDGHTITYDNKPELDKSKVTPAYKIKPHKFGGIYTYGSKAGARLFNGIIKQGAGKRPLAHGVNLSGAGDEPELAGLTIEVHGQRTACVFSFWEGTRKGHIHHNLLLDRGKAEDIITHRMGGLMAGSKDETAAITLSVGAYFTTIDHNIIDGCRFRGIRFSEDQSIHADVFENDIYFEGKRHKLSAGISAVQGSNFKIHHNRIFGSGKFAHGIALRRNANWCKVYSNRIKVTCTEDKGEASGIRLEFGPWRHDIYDNTVVVYADADSPVRGIKAAYVKFDDTNIDVHHNRVFAFSRHKNAEAACVHLAGMTETSTLVFRDNRFVGNRDIVRISDKSGCSRDVRFIRNTFVRDGNHENFSTIRCGHGVLDGSALFAHTQFENGAGFESVKFEGSGKKRELLISRMQELYVKDKNDPLGMARIRVSDSTGADYNCGSSPDSGKVQVPVVEYALTPKGKSVRTPSKIVVEKDGYCRSVTPVKKAGKPIDIVMKKGDPDSKDIVAELVAKYPDKSKPEGDWDWLRAPLTKVYGEWEHASRTSASVYFRTDGQAWGYVEFGEGTKYDRRTWPYKKPVLAQLHHLRGLEPGKTYHYRIVAIGIDGKRVVSQGKTVTTRIFKNAIRVPGDLEGPPYVLDRQGATYILTKEIVVKLDAVNIAASDIIFDIDGRTIVYGRFPCDEKTRGISGKCRNLTIVNGIVKQGENTESRSHAIAFGGKDAKGLQVYGIYAEVGGESSSALDCRYIDEADVHHNMFWDRGHRIQNRHMQIRLVRLGIPRKSKTRPRFHHNILVDARHTGAAVSGEVFENVIYQISHCTNGVAISCAGGSIIHHNYIIGRGEHCIAMWGGTGAKIYNNKVDSCSDLQISGEYGALAAVGFRTDYGGMYEGLEYHENVIVIRAKNDPARCYKTGYSWIFWLAACDDIRENPVFRNNTMVAMVYEGATTVGLAMCSASQNVLFENNTIISNYRCVTFGTHRGDGLNSKWISNTFARLGNNPAFSTFGSRAQHNNNILIDSRFKGGADYDFKSGWQGGSLLTQQYLDISVKDDLGKPVSDAVIGISDKDGNPSLNSKIELSVSTETTSPDLDVDEDAFDLGLEDGDKASPPSAGIRIITGKTDSQGKFRIPLTQYVWTPQSNAMDRMSTAENKKSLTPHRITVSKQGYGTVSKKVKMDGNKKLAVVLKKN